MLASTFRALVPVALAAVACSPLGTAEGPSGPGGSSGSKDPEIPISFIENVGQLPNPAVSIYAETPSGAIGFTPTGLRLGLADQAGTQQAWSLAMDFVGGRAMPRAGERQQGLVSYFRGGPDEWRTGLPTHGEVIYRDVWPGIDLIYRSSGSQLKYDFVVHPGADPARIRLRWRGATDLALGEDGSLTVRTPAGSLTDEAPVSMQGSRPVETSFVLDGTEVGFHLASYDRTRPLVIDPVMTLYSGYIGGAGPESANGVAVDGAGAAYVAGSTPSDATTFPETVGPFTTHGGGYDAFIAKVNPSGTGLVYAGYIGGTGHDQGLGVAVDPAGAAYVVGNTETEESSFPVMTGPDTNYNGGDTDGFIAKVNPSGTGLVYAGYIGAGEEDTASGVAVDGSGVAYVVGLTNSPATALWPSGGPSTTNAGGNDAFVAKIGATGSPVYSGYIGGSGTDFGIGIAIDSAGAAYVGGSTNSTQTSFPEAVGPDLTHNGGNDAFVAKVHPSGSSLQYAGFVGGFEGELGLDVGVDPAGAAYITGTTLSTPATFPAMGGPSLTFSGVQDAFVAKVHPSGTGFQYAGYIGGGAHDAAWAIEVDASGAAYVGGETDSDASSFPEVGGPLLAPRGERDGFVAKLSPSGSIVYAGFFGGEAYDQVRDVALDPSGDLYLIGETNSQVTFPIVRGPSPVYEGSLDGFVAKLRQDRCLGQAFTHHGTAGADTLVGTAAADVFMGIGGNDSIFGLGGNDLICAGGGNDRVRAGGGADRVSGESGNDRLSGQGGKDRLSGGGGNDRLNGGSKRDRCNGGGGRRDSATNCERLRRVP